MCALRITVVMEQQDSYACGLLRTICRAYRSIASIETVRQKRHAKGHLTLVTVDRQSRFCFSPSISIPVTVIIVDSSTVALLNTILLRLEIVHVPVGQARVTVLDRTKPSKKLLNICNESTSAQRLHRISNHCK